MPQHNSRKSVRSTEAIAASKSEEVSELHEIFLAAGHADDAQALRVKFDQIKAECGAALDEPGAIDTMKDLRARVVATGKV